MWELSHALAELFSEMGVAQQALSLISTPIEILDVPDAKPLCIAEGRIEFDNVTFHYKQGKRVFNKKSLIIEPKQKVGVVGYSGSGKSTLINLILRTFDVEKGKILLDNQDIAKVTQASLRNAVSMIPQDTSLFHRTLLENIRYGDLNASDNEVIDASKKADCHDFIVSLDTGYQTMVGERGVKLSGGQRQRIAIARAFLKKTPILILDEATSQLDSLTEARIHASLFSLMKDRTTVVIAHRLSTLLQMDRILVMHDGKIVEEGSHHSLLINDGYYKTMWDAQIGGFLPDKKT